MKILSSRFTGAAAALMLATASIASADSLAGRWDATVTVNGTVIPFRLDLSEDGPGFKQAFHARSSPGGWGLLIVSLLADRWGSTYRGGESCVWFEVGSPQRGGAPTGPRP